MSTINARNAQDAANPVHLSFSEKRQPLLQGDAHHYLMARGDQLAFFGGGVFDSASRRRTSRSTSSAYPASTRRLRRRRGSPSPSETFIAWAARRTTAARDAHGSPSSCAISLPGDSGNRRRSRRNDRIVRAAGPAGQSPLMLAALTIGVQRANSSLICVAKRSGVPPAASMPKAAKPFARLGQAEECAPTRGSAGEQPPRASRLAPTARTTS